MANIFEDIASLIEIPDKDHAVVWTSCDLLTIFRERLPLGVESNRVYLVFVSFEGSEKLGVLLLFDHRLI